MSWDSLCENIGYYAEVASNRMARRALHVEVKSLNKLSENETIGEWLPFLPQKGLTKSLKRDIGVIIAKKLAEKANKATQGKGEKVYPDDLV